MQWLCQAHVPACAACFGSRSPPLAADALSGCSISRELHWNTVCPRLEEDVTAVRAGTAATPRATRRKCLNPLRAGPGH